jgi:hypothetical protein
MQSLRKLKVMDGWINWILVKYNWPVEYKYSDEK